MYASTKHNPMGNAMHVKRNNLMRTRCIHTNLRRHDVCTEDQCMGGTCEGSIMGSPSDFMGVTCTLCRETRICIVVACIGVVLIPF